MEDKVLHFIATQQLVKKHSKVLVGVSGGPDSLALLHFLHDYRKLLNIEVIALAIDHQLRGEVSKEDVLYVGKVCEALNIPFIARSLEVTAYKQKHQLGTQVAARILRYQLFEREMKLHHVDYLALGHHGDDQIETVIMALTKTTTLKNLTGIPLQRDFSVGKIIRPFLCVTKTEIEQYCEQHHLEPRIDGSNFEKTYTRNRIRADIVPNLRQENPNISATIQQLTQTLQEDESLLVEQAKKAFSSVVQTNSKTKIASILIRDLEAYPVSLQRRIFRLTLDYLYDEIPEQFTYKHEAAFLALLTKSGNKVIDFPNQCKVEKVYDTLRCYFAAERQDNQGYEQLIDHLPTSITLPDGATLAVHVTTKSGVQGIKQGPSTYLYPRAEVSFPMTVRTRRPGDRMTYEGLAGTKKIKDIFIDKKIARQDRERQYMVTDAYGEILWLIGLKKRPWQQQTEMEEFLLFEYIDNNPEK